MSRKLRFFSDQISKAGVKSSVIPALQLDIDLEELEVHCSSFLNRSFLLQLCIFIRVAVQDENK
jgi:hypothetical protein